MTLGDVELMRQLHGGGRRRFVAVHELVAELDADAGAAAAALDRLERTGLVTSCAAAARNGGRLVCLTGRGEHRLRELDAG